MRILFVLILSLTLEAVLAQPSNLVFNGSFELGTETGGRPKGWQSAGNPAVVQRLRLEPGREGGQCAKLDCTSFGGDGPDYHAMICQMGQVGVRAGRWYRLAFWARGEIARGSAVDVGLSNTKPWQNAGLDESFLVRREWRRFEFLFRAREELPAATSRLQFWFKGTGQLWLDDVSLAETEEGIQWFPQIACETMQNFIPNSSFECGTANWGSLTYGLAGLFRHLYRLEGELDVTQAWHGSQSLRLRLTPQTCPTYWFDYYEPVRQPVHRVLTANLGWFRVKPGEKLTLSAYLKADAEEVMAELAVNQVPSRLQRKAVRVGREWARHEFTFSPSEAFLFVAVGLNLEASRREAATLWLDALQLERGDHATPYAPRQSVEAFASTGVLGNIFTNTPAGLPLRVRAYNNSASAQLISGRLAVRDFYDVAVAETNLTGQIPPQGGTNFAVNGLNGGRHGFFRAQWISGSATQDVRCAVIEPAASPLRDSPLGFNHAYPWDYLVGLARQAGVVWWRDWSAKWNTVEPRPGEFDFSVPDAQIGRVLAQNSSVLVLLPFPSAGWSSTADPAQVEKTAGRDGYLKTRLPMAYPPKNLNDFGRFTTEVVRHYRRTGPPSVTHFQILNEPVYTSYALPRQFGYGLDDYLRLLGVAYQAAKAADPTCVVVGGISANLEAGLTLDFVKRGGLRSVDVLDLHDYDPPRSAESFEASFAALEETMAEHGGPKPVWMTEWGCYADDDPPCLPWAAGDAAMNRSRWPDERTATEHIVKFTTVAFAHGVRKIFFHAGTCGPINGSDAGGVLFEYGGTPRKMYAGVATLTRLLGVPDRFAGRRDCAGFRAYMFETGGHAVAVCWANEDATNTYSARPLSAQDIMGNPLPNSVNLKANPLFYLEAPDIPRLSRVLPAVQ